MSSEEARYRRPKPGQQVVEGERLMESPITGDVYRVTRWIEAGDGRAIALEKEPVEEADQ